MRLKPGPDSNRNRVLSILNIVHKFQLQLFFQHANITHYLEYTAYLAIKQPKPAYFPGNLRALVITIRHAGFRHPPSPRPPASYQSRHLNSIKRQKINNAISTHAPPPPDITALCPYP
ncbi:hypothetical protein SDC9_204628 [bioreactor metagenome]|uniref:Uncharacterized protein n=1 Tax=bioreactor metagenome TaxID=1076179 RepID=A0A645IZR0_9ZZZZ